MAQAPNTKILQLLKRTLAGVSISKDHYGRIINIYSQVHTGVLVKLFEKQFLFYFLQTHQSYKVFVSSISIREWLQ